MAIHYRLLQNRIKGSKNYGKYYAHTVKRGVISLEDIEAMIEENCTAYTVDLREMGKLSISVKSVCVDDPKEFRRDRHITGFKCNYTPEGKRYKSFDGQVKGHIHRSLLDGCEAIETRYYNASDSQDD